MRRHVIFTSSFFFLKKIYLLLDAFKVSLFAWNQSSIFESSKFAKSYKLCKFFENILGFRRSQCQFVFSKGSSIYREWHVWFTMIQLGFPAFETFRKKCENLCLHFTNFFAKFQNFSRKWIKRKNAKTNEAKFRSQKILQRKLFLWKMRNFHETIFRFRWKPYLQPFSDKF